MQELYISTHLFWTTRCQSMKESESDKNSKLQNWWKKKAKLEGMKNLKLQNWWKKKGFIN